MRSYPCRNRFAPRLALSGPSPAPYAPRESLLASLQYLSIMTLSSSSSSAGLKMMATLASSSSCTCSSSATAIARAAVLARRQFQTSARQRSEKGKEADAAGSATSPQQLKQAASTRECWTPSASCQKRLHVCSVGHRADGGARRLFASTTNTVVPFLDIRDFPYFHDSAQAGVRAILTARPREPLARAALYIWL